MDMTNSNAKTIFCKQKKDKKYKISVLVWIHLFIWIFDYENRFQHIDTILIHVFKVKFDTDRHKKMIFFDMKYHEWNFCTKDENYKKLIVAIQTKKNRFLERLFEHHRRLPGWRFTASLQSCSFRSVISLQKIANLSNLTKSINFMNKKWENWHVNACSEKVFNDIWWYFIGSAY